MQKAVKYIQQCASEVRKEANLLVAAGSSLGGPGARTRVQEHVRLATCSGDEARRLLDRFRGITGVAASEQQFRQLQYQKLKENLSGAMKVLEEAWRDFEEAEERARKDAQATSPPPRAGAAAGVELADAAMHEPLPVPRQQQHQSQQQVVTDAEIEAHSQIVSETANQISSVSNDIRALQRAMVDLAEHTESQGTVLDSIESNVARASERATNATELLTNASRQQQRGIRWVFWLLLAATVIAGIVVAAVVHHSAQHHHR